MPAGKANSRKAQIMARVSKIGFLCVIFFMCCGSKPPEGEPNRTDVPTMTGGHCIVIAVRGQGQNKTITLNAGSEKGVKKGMTFYVARGADYVCTVTIDNVAPTTSSGIVSNEKLPPATSDRAEYVEPSSRPASQPATAQTAPGASG
jgi:hypothetical protein